MDRSQLKKAEYNPRRISNQARERLKDNLKRVGLVKPLVLNKQTGNLLEGHQRLALLDAFHKGKPYRLSVAVVDLDRVTEREQNMFLNNAQAMGEWDLEKLSEELSGELDAEKAGFDIGDVYKLIGKDPAMKTGEEFLAVAEKIRSSVEMRAKAADKMKDADNPHFYLVVLFQSYEDRKQFTDQHGLEDNRYLSIESLVAAVKQKKGKG